MEDTLCIRPLWRRVVLHLQLHVHTIEHMSARICRAVQCACVQQYELSVVVTKLSTRKTGISFSKVVRLRAERQRDSESEQARLACAADEMP